MIFRVLCHCSADLCVRACKITQSYEISCKYPRSPPQNMLNPTGILMMAGSTGNCKISDLFEKFVFRS